jgi:biotin carboxyl carrier protein
MLTALVDSRRYRRSGGGPAAAAGEVRVTAPMPGRVLRILVKPGDEVAARQGLVVVEAMKMENEIGAPKAGRIKEVAASAGQSVESGRLLVVIE